ncbi:5-formyltetrahydrofolate cyclo-ligase [Chelatococcus sp. GCM10030263]|uniref:5-formyltetrahydrofolate cyclo-ligase n=1 Tax=Chelatococcus sp. GCM10030263 TaxID=3273387 RepID=UPI0036143D62
MNDTAIAGRKKAIRAAVLPARAAFAAEQGEAASAALATLALTLPELAIPAAVVGGYWPIRGEADPRPLLAELQARGAVLGLPVVTGAGLLFRRWDRGVPLVSAGLGTLGPPAEAPLMTPSILFVPLAAFDRRCHRLGYGKGFYDHAIAQLTAAVPQPRLVTIGLAYAMQEVPHIPVEAHDRCLDAIVTERGVIRAPDGPA